MPAALDPTGSLPVSRTSGHNAGLKSVAVRFSFASARVDSGSRAETPQSATLQKRGGVVQVVVAARIDAVASAPPPFCSSSIRASCIRTGEREGLIRRRPAVLYPRKPRPAAAESRCSWPGMSGTRPVLCPTGSRGRLGAIMRGRVCSTCSGSSGRQAARPVRRPAPWAGLAGLHGATRQERRSSARRPQ